MEEGVGDDIISMKGAVVCDEVGDVILHRVGSFVGEGDC